MDLCYDGQLLLDFGEGCPYRGIQATGGKKIVLNNELT